MTRGLLQAPVSCINWNWRGTGARHEPPARALESTTMSTQSSPGGGTDTAVVTKTKPKLQKASRYLVVFYNDDYTTKWFVVDVLMGFFHMTEANATAFMLEVHETGKGVAGIYTRDVAETKVQQVTEHAKEYEMPLRLDIEPEGDGDDRGGDL